MTIDLIVPNMALYGNPEMMLLIKTVNQLIKSDTDHLRTQIKQNEKIAELEREIDYLKKAQRNL